MKKNYLLSMTVIGLMMLIPTLVKAVDPIIVANFEDNGTDRLVEGRFMEASSYATFSKFEIVDRPLTINGNNSSNKVLKVYDVTFKGRIYLNLRGANIPNSSDEIDLTPFNTVSFKYARSGDFARPKGSGTNIASLYVNIHLEGRDGASAFKGVVSPNTPLNDQWHDVTFTITNDVNVNISFIELSLFQNQEAPIDAIYDQSYIYIDDIEFSYTPPASVNTNKYTNLSVFANERKLNILNAPVGATYTVYNILGKKLYTSVTDNLPEDYMFPASGTYLVSVSEAGQSGKMVTRKVIVK